MGPCPAAAAGMNWPTGMNWPSGGTPCSRTGDKHWWAAVPAGIRRPAEWGAPGPLTSAGCAGWATSSVRACVRARTHLGKPTDRVDRRKTSTSFPVTQLPTHLHQRGLHPGLPLPCCLPLRTGRRMPKLRVGHGRQNRLGDGDEGRHIGDLRHGQRQRRQAQRAGRRRCCCCRRRAGLLSCRAGLTAAVTSCRRCCRGGPCLRCRLAGAAVPQRLQRSIERSQWRLCRTRGACRRSASRGLGAGGPCRGRRRPRRGRRCGLEGLQRGGVGRREGRVVNGIGAGDGIGVPLQRHQNFCLINRAAWGG